jgi:hypothetical protein
MSEEEKKEEVYEDKRVEYAEGIRRAITRGDIIRLFAARVKYRKYTS